MHLHPVMHKFFLFTCGGKVYRCLAPSFGWGLAAYHFGRFLRTLVTYLRNVCGYRILWYLADFRIAPKWGKGARRKDCRRAQTGLEHTLEAVGLATHPTIGV